MVEMSSLYALEWVAVTVWTMVQHILQCLLRVSEAQWRQLAYDIQPVLDCLVAVCWSLFR